MVCGVEWREWRDVVCVSAVRVLYYAQRVVWSDGPVHASTPNCNPRRPTTIVCTRRGQISRRSLNLTIAAAEWFSRYAGCYSGLVHLAYDTLCSPSLAV